ncbi:GtrA family protein [Paenibacillus sp. sptzw28]|uniref:GtrA family protein n=1 Tax=Paenibacillus sp. sptzw28 TaxID=715179 RepID=UPI001C6E8F47|nr:GtrA family protein [Paenibacillus sp. sptzw28]QYR21472.1 GtrA family protein [Paenibacillus sp. sptzw28]
MKNRLAPLLKFCFVGALNTGVDLIVFMLLTAGGVMYMPAQYISYGAGICNSYLLNSSWTFRGTGKRNRREISRYIAVSLLSLAVASIILELLHEHTRLTLFVCKLIATAGSVTVNYAGSRYWVFGSPHKRSISLRENRNERV